MQKLYLTASQVWDLATEHNIKFDRGYDEVVFHDERYPEDVGDKIVQASTEYDKYTYNKVPFEHMYCVPRVSILTLINWLPPTIAIKDDKYILRIDTYGAGYFNVDKRSYLSNSVGGAYTNGTLIDVLCGLLIEVKDYLK